MTPDSHCRWTEDAAAFALGTLGAEAHDAFREHLLEGCGPCGHALAEARRALALLDEAAAEDAPTTAADPGARARLALSLSGRRPTEPVRVVLADDGAWRSFGVPGVEARVLHVDTARRRMTVLLRMTAGAIFPGHVHDEEETSFLVSGDLHSCEKVLGPGDFLVAPSGSTHEPQRTDAGCTVLVTTSLDAFRA